MVKIHELLVGAAMLVTRLAAGCHDREHDERGDVPGWVFVAVMSATVVAGLIAIAEPELQRMLRQALRSVG